MSISDLLDRSFKLYRSHFVLIVGTFMVFGAPLIALTALETIFFHLAAPGLGNPVAVWSEMFRHGGSAAPLPQIQVRPEYMAIGYLFWGLALLWNLFSGWALGATHWAAAAAHLEYRPTIRDALRAAGRRFWSLVGASILIGLILAAVVVLGCCVLGLPAALLLWAGLCLTLPVIVLEGQTCGAGLSRSYALVKPDFWRILLWSLLLIGLFILLAMMVWLLGMGLGAVFMLVGAQNLGGVLSNVIYIVLVNMVSPLLYIGLTLIYFDQRSRLEYFDVRYGAQALGLAPPGSITR